MLYRASKGLSWQAAIVPKQSCITVDISISSAISTRSKCKIKLNIHADISIKGDNSLITHIHDNDRSVDMQGYDLKDGHKCVKTVNAVAAYVDS